MSGVSSKIENLLNRDLETSERTLYLDGGRKYYYLPAYPIDITASFVVTVDGTVKTVNSDYFIYEQEGLLKFMYEVCSSEPKILKVVYTGGYTSSSGVLQVPDALKLLCVQQCAYEFSRRLDAGSVSTTMPNGNSGYQSGLDWLPAVKKALYPFRRTSGGI